MIDASFAQETVVEPNGAEKPHRTQKAFMDLLVNPDTLKDDTAGCHAWAWGSLTDKRFAGPRGNVKPMVCEAVSRWKTDSEPSFAIARIT